MKTYKEFVKEAKADAIIAVAKLAKKAITPKNIANSKKVIRNMRFFPQIVNQSAADAMRQTKHLQRRGISGKFPNFTPKDTPDKYSKLAIQKKSIHPPTADAAQSKATDIKIEIARARNKRRRETEGILNRIFNKS